MASERLRQGSRARRGSLAALGKKVNQRKAASGAEEQLDRPETQVAHHGGRDIDENALAADLVFANVAADHPADAAQTPALALVDERRFELADQEILVIGQDPTRLEEPVVSAKNGPH